MNYLRAKPTVRRAVSFLAIVSLTVLVVIVFSTEKDQYKKRKAEKVAETILPALEEQAKQSQLSCGDARQKAINSEAPIYATDGFGSGLELQQTADTLLEKKEFKLAAEKYSRAEAIFEQSATDGTNNASLERIKSQFEKRCQEIGPEFLSKYGDKDWLSIRVSIDRHAGDPVLQKQAYREASERLTAVLPKMRLRKAEALIEKGEVSEGFSLLVSVASDSKDTDYIRLILLRMSERDPAAWNRLALDYASVIKETPVRIWTFLGYAMDDQKREDERNRCFEKARQAGAFMLGETGCQANLTLANVRQELNVPGWRDSLCLAKDVAETMKNITARRNLLTEIAGVALGGGDETTFAGSIGAIVGEPPEKNRDRQYLYREDVYYSTAGALMAAGRVQRALAMTPPTKNTRREGLPFAMLARGAWAASYRGDDETYRSVILKALPYFYNKSSHYQKNERLAPYYLSGGDASAGQYERTVITSHYLPYSQRIDAISLVASQLAKTSRYEEAIDALSIADELLIEAPYGLSFLQAIYDVVTAGPGLDEPFAFDRLIDQKTVPEVRIALMSAMADRYGPGGNEPYGQISPVPRESLDRVDLAELGSTDWLLHALAELQCEFASVGTATLAIELLESATKAGSDVRTAARSIAWDGILRQYREQAETRAKKSIRSASLIDRQTYEASSLIRLMLRLADAENDSGDYSTASETVFTALRSTMMLGEKWQRGRHLRAELMICCATHARDIGDLEVFEACRIMINGTRTDTKTFDNIVALETNQLPDVDLTSKEGRRLFGDTLSREYSANFLAQVAVVAAKNQDAKLYRQSASMVTQLLGDNTSHPSVQLLALADLAVGAPDFGVKRLGKSRSLDAQLIRAEIVDAIAIEHTSLAETMVSDSITLPLPLALAECALARAFASVQRTDDEYRDYLKKINSPLTRAGVMIGFAQAESVASK